MATARKDPTVREQLDAALAHVNNLTSNVNAAQKVCNQQAGEITELKFRLAKAEGDRDEAVEVARKLQNDLEEAKSSKAARQLSAAQRRKQAAQKLAPAKK